MIKRWITGITGLLCGGLLVLMITNVGTIHAQSNTCELINHQEQMLVYFAPMVAGSQIKDILPKDTPYTMIGRTESFFKIEYNDEEQGWIEFHTRILNGTCPAIDHQPPLDIALSDFPTVCFYVTNQNLIGYSDPELTQQHPGFGMRESGGTYAVTSISETAIGMMGTSAMSGGYVEANKGTFWGHCSGTLQLATALDYARVWSQPDAIAGDVITTLDVGAEVGVLGDRVVGNIQDGITGEWVQITHRDILGWVWIERLDFGRTFTTQQPALAQATVLDNARLWSQPDVKSGAIITTLMLGSDVNIIGDSATGAIQFDSDLEGIWYPVQQGGNTGWLYEGRFSLGS